MKDGWSEEVKDGWSEEVKDGWSEEVKMDGVRGERWME